jgi:hypothetical protein
LKDLFPGLGLEFPKMYSLFWGKSAKIHAEVLERRKALAPPAVAAAAAAPLPKIKIPVAAPAPAEEEKAVTPTYGNQKSGPTTPVFGGSGTTRKTKKMKVRKTRTASAKDLATVFTRLWKAHAKKK